MFWHPDPKECELFPIIQQSFSSSTCKRGGVWMRKLGVVSQERLKIDVKLLLSADSKLYNYAASIGALSLR